MTYTRLPFRALLLPALLGLPLAACNSGTQGGSDAPLSTANNTADVVITSQPQAETITAGQTAQFSVSAVDNKGRALSYQWLRNGGVISGATASSYSFVAQAADTGASFSVVVTDQNGCLQSLYSSGKPDSDGKRCVVSGSAALTVGGGGTGLSSLAGNIGGNGNLNGTGSGARFNLPLGLAVDPNGNVFVADTGNAEIRKVTPAGVVTSFAGQADVPGLVDGTGSAARFSSVTADVFDASGNLYVLDSSNRAIRKITPAGLVSTFVAPSATTCGNNLGNPYGMTFDHAGNLLVTNANCSSISMVSPAGVVTPLIQGSLTPGGDPNINSVVGIVVDSHGNIFVANNNANDIVEIAAGTTTVSVFAGSKGIRGSADGTGTAARFGAPEGLAIDSADNIYVADSNHTIRKITPAGVVTTIAGTADAPGAKDGVGTAASFYAPYGITLDAAGNLYVTDALNNSVRKITPAGVVSTLAGLAGAVGTADGTGAAATFNFTLGTGGSLAVDGSGNLYTNQFLDDIVRKITPAGVVSTVVGLAGVYGTNDGVGSATRAYYPVGMAVDAAGNAYFINKNYPGTAITNFNYVIRKISPAGVVSTPPLSSGDGSTLDYSVAGLAVDGSGNTFIIDGNAILKVDNTGVLTAFVGGSAAGSADGAGSAASFNYPTAITIDAAGNLYVTDANNATIRKITPAGVVSTIAGTAGVFGINDGTGAAAQFYRPTAITVDPAGNLYVGDGPATVRKITPAGVVTTIIGVPGQIGITLGTTPTLGPITGLAVSGSKLYITCSAAALLQFQL